MNEEFNPILSSPSFVEPNKITPKRWPETAFQHEPVREPLERHSGYTAGPGPRASETKSTTVPSGSSGRVWSTCLVFRKYDVPFLRLEGTHSPTVGFHRVNRAPMFTIFLCFFFRPSFWQRLIPKALKIKAPKQLKIIKNWKKGSPKRTHSQDLKKDSVWQGPNLWNWQPLKHFQLFSQRPRALKVEPKWKPKWSPRAPEPGLAGRKTISYRKS